MLFLKAGANIKRFLYKAIPFVVFFFFFFKSQKWHLNLLKKIDIFYSKKIDFFEVFKHNCLLMNNL